MPRTVAGLRPEPALVDPGWRRWLDLVELAVAESQHPAWSAGVLLRERRAPEAPLLHGATLRVDPSRATGFVGRVAGEFGIVATEAIAVVALIRAGIERDSGAFDVAANTLAVPADTVAVLAQLGAMPLLLNAARSLSPEASRTWQRGYCPVCGAWPSMVEMRGIQRERRMRCGCCGSDWLLPVLRCAFCDEIDHQKLGSLMSEGEEQHVRVETCKSCQGYLKSVTTLGAQPVATLVAKDLSTVVFDLAAQDRGYTRPHRPGWQLSVEVAQ
jgi:FdhE protein